MDWVKEVIEATNSKIKSPILGSVIFSFCVVNWKVLFYLFFAKATVIEKFGHFDSNTSLLSLFIIPIFIGLLLSLINPWLKLYFLRILKKPIQDEKVLQISLAHDRLMKKQEFEKLRRELNAEVESDLIAKAKRDQEVLSIENAELREKLQNSISNIRKNEVLDLSSDGQKQTKYIRELSRLKDLLAFYDERKELAVRNNDFSNDAEFDRKIAKLIEQIEMLSDKTFFDENS